MLRKIARAVTVVRDQAFVAKELSAGLYEAVATVVRGPSIDSFEAILVDHAIRLERELPGF
jgi:hypothetical protein